MFKKYNYLTVSANILKVIYQIFVIWFIFQKLSDVSKKKIRSINNIQFEPELS